MSATSRTSKPTQEGPNCFTGVLKSILQSRGTFQSLTPVKEGYIASPNDSHILEEIDYALACFLQQVRAYRNLHLPIMRLPPDVMTIIFAILQEPMLEMELEYDSYGRGPNFLKEYAWDWLNVTWVCQHWRTIALSCPSLWSSILVDQMGGSDGLVDLMQTSLLRSRQAHLTVNIHAIHVSPIPILPEVLSHLSHVRELALYGILTRSERQLLMDTPAPHLKALSIHGNLAEIFPTSLPPLFANNTPALRYLSIRRYSHLDQCSFRNLKQLRLDLQEFETNAQIQSLLDMLDGNPTLEDLMFRRLRIDEHILALPSEHRVSSLPMLQKLWFKETRLKCASCALSLLRLPPAISVIADGTSAWEGLDAMLRVISSRASPEMKKILINLPCEISILGDLSGYKLGCDIHADEEELDAFAEVMASVMGEAEELWVTGAHPTFSSSVVQSQLRRILIAAVNCKKLVVDTYTKGAALNWLVALNGTPSEDTTPIIPCPHLHELHVCDPTGKNWDALLLGLKARKLRGSPLEVLRIYPSSFIRSRSRHSPEDLQFDNRGPQNDDPPNIDPHVTFKKWANIASTELYPLVKDPQFSESKTPSLIPHLPDICTVQSRGRWEWPIWTADTFSNCVESDFDGYDSERSEDDESDPDADGSDHDDDHHVVDIGFNLFANL